MTAKITSKMARRKRTKRWKRGFFIVIILGIFLVMFMMLRTLFPRPYREEIEQLSQTYGLETSLLYGVILTESNFREEAVSPAGARGLMQITEETGEFIARKLSLDSYSVEDLFLPEKNMLMGSYYLSYLSGRFSQIETVLAAYNAGPNRVAQWLEDETLSDGKTLTAIPFEETKNYVDRVLLRQTIYKLLYMFE